MCIRDSYHGTLTNQNPGCISSLGSTSGCISDLPLQNIEMGLAICVEITYITPIIIRNCHIKWGFDLNQVGKDLFAKIIKLLSGYKIEYLWFKYVNTRIGLIAQGDVYKRQIPDQFQTARVITGLVNGSIQIQFSRLDVYKRQAVY